MGKQHQNKSEIRGSESHRVQLFSRLPLQGTSCDPDVLLNGSDSRLRCRVPRSERVVLTREAPVCRCRSGRHPGLSADPWPWKDGTVEGNLAREGQGILKGGGGGPFRRGPGMASHREVGTDIENLPSALTRTFSVFTRPLLGHMQRPSSWALKPKTLRESTQRACLSGSRGGGFPPSSLLEGPWRL